MAKIFIITPNFELLTFKLTTVSQNIHNHPEFRIFTVRGPQCSNIQIFKNQRSPQRMIGPIGQLRCIKPLQSQL